MKVVCMLYGRNEEKTLPDTLPTLVNQGFSDIIYVDDCSRDNSIQVAEKFNVTIIKRKIPHKSYIGKALLSKVVNEGIKAIYDIPDIDYFMITGCDIRLSENYMKALIQRMENNKRLMICSGIVEGEYTVFSSPRGAGRIYRFSFWDKYIKRFPLSYIWESYPVYKALSLNYKACSFRDIMMITSRPTKSYKSGYGYAMREIGYLWTHALIECFMVMLKNRLVGIQMLKTYLFSGLSVCDKDVSKWIRRYQIHRYKPSNLLNGFRNLVKRL